MKKQKIRIVFFALLLIFGIGFLFLARSKQSPSTTVTPSKIVIEKLPFDNLYPPPVTNVIFSYSGPRVTLPAALPVYRVSYPDNLPSAAERLARELGISAPVKHPVSYVYDWDGNGKHFSFNGRSFDVSFSVSTASVSSSLLPQQVLALLGTSGFVSPPLTYSEADRQTISGSEGGGVFTSVSYQVKTQKDNFPFLFITGSKTSGSIRLNQQGQMISFSFFVTPQAIRDADRPALNLEQALTELNNQKGLLTSVRTGESGYVADPAPSFTKAGVTSIEPAFLYLSEAGVFIPVYIVEGSGTDTAGAVQYFRYLLRATN